jgi:hypothetical protein
VAPRPVEVALHGIAHCRDRTLAEGVPDVVALLAHVDDCRAGQRPGVVGLATTSGIERGPVEHHCPSRRVDIRDGRVERSDVGVAQVEKLGDHRQSLP